MILYDAILLGGGSGTRFNGASSGNSNRLPKQFQLVNGYPVFILALQSLLELDLFRSLVVTAPAEHIERTRQLIDQFVSPNNKAKIQVIEGGARRQDSSRLAMEALDKLSPQPTRILIHDACRPFLSSKLLSNIKTCLQDRSYGAWVPVVPISETLKRVENSQVVETVDRTLVQRVQTPQIFEFSVIRPLMERIKTLEELNFTDDASLCEYYGIPVGAFEGDVRNIKLTYDFELEMLQNILTRDATNSAGVKNEMVGN